VAPFDIGCQRHLVCRRPKLVRLGMSHAAEAEAAPEVGILICGTTPLVRRTMQIGWAIRLKVLRVIVLLMECNRGEH
jgi:hypothetical protein